MLINSKHANNNESRQKVELEWVQSLVRDPGSQWRNWCSGNIQDSHSCAMGSIPVLRRLLLDNKRSYWLLVLFEFGFNRI
jgi:hypothetical protein